MQKIDFIHWQCPCGILMIAGLNDRLVMSDWVDGWHHKTILNRFNKLIGLPFVEGSSCVIDEAVNQLEDYFRGERRAFDLPLTLIGTDFQKDVWHALQSIPYGSRPTYADIARAIGKPKAIRAVGGAVGQNPFSIIIPCHRVVGANQSLTGYGGGLEAKKYLLALETSQLFQSQEA